MADPTLEATLMFVLNQHRGQVDLAGRPYILHVLRVMLSFTTEEEQTVGALHDVVGDRGVQLTYLQAMRYPAKIIEAVECLTKRPEEADDYDAFIRRVATGSLLARRVKIADLKDNANLKRFTIPTVADRQRRKKYRAAIRLLQSSVQPQASPDETQP